MIADGSNHDRPRASGSDEDRRYWFWMEAAYPSMAKVAAPILAHYGLTLAQVRRSSKKAALVRVRWEIMWAIRQVRREGGRPYYSEPRIAKFLGLKDHTTVCHGLQQYEKIMEGAG